MPNLPAWHLNYIRRIRVGFWGRFEESVYTCVCMCVCVCVCLVRAAGGNVDCNFRGRGWGRSWDSASRDKSPVSSKREIDRDGAASSCCCFYPTDHILPSMCPPAAVFLFVNASATKRSRSCRAAGRPRRRHLDTRGVNDVPTLAWQTAKWRAASACLPEEDEGNRWMGRGRGLRNRKQRQHALWSFKAIILTL